MALAGDRRRWWLLIIVLLVSLTVAAASVADAAAEDPGGAFVAQYQHTEDPATRLTTFGDGQFFGMLAEDPTLARPNAVVAHDPEPAFAYRAMRPGFSWAGWAVAGGNPRIVPWALIALTVASVGMLFLGVHHLARALHRDPSIAVLVVALPGVIRLLGWTGPEIAASACACFATAAALKHSQRRAAVWLVAAVLLRETLLLVVVGLVLGRLLQLRWAILPLAAIGSWIVIVRLRVGAWPEGGTRFEAGGIFEAIPSWGPLAWVSAAGLLILIVVAAARSGLARALILPHVALVATMASITWEVDDFSRILLPLYAVLLAFLGPACSSRDAATVSTGIAPTVASQTRATP